MHLNIWAGLGAYKSLRELDLPLVLFLQKSGDRIITGENQNFRIDFRVFVKIAGLIGIDIMHVGMWGGYLSDNEKYLNSVISVARDYQIMSSLSCGMHPGIVNKITEKFGSDYLANVGGAIHGHPGGTIKGTLAMRQAIDKEYGKEYFQAVKKWGLIK
jgi:ribulose 1,5-bisphosphate carboxylase large subunit-like protein